MFSGLNSLLRKVLPKRLFYRALLIVAVPVIVLQLVITIVFFDSLWIKTNKGMTRTLVNEISAFIEAYESEKTDKQEINNLFSLFLDLNIELKTNEELQNQQNERWFSPIDRTLRRELKSKFSIEDYWFDSTNYKELIDLNKLIIVKNNKEFKINNTEKIILEKMINNPGNIFSRENIGQLISLDKERSIDVIITRLRKKIEIDPKNPKFLQTIRGAGYVLWIE